MIMSAGFYRFTSLVATCLGLAVSAFAAPAPPDKPFLWRVEGNGLETPSHLFGTIHLSNDRIARLHPAADRAFEEADVFHAEISMEAMNQNLGIMLMIRRDEKRLSDSIGPELTDRLKAHLQGIRPGLDIAILQPMKTWAAAMMIVMLPHQLEGREALDTILWNRATQLGKATSGLEKIEDQIGAFDKLNEAEQIIYLRETLAALSDEEDPMAKMIAAYESGDEKKLHQILTDSMKLDGDDDQVRATSERLIKALITDRDISIAARIHEILTGQPEKSHFFAVGAAHYLGENSVRKHLADKGYKITRILE